ncbi:MAG TPA: hypothetical protein DCM24_01745 [Synergistaceae bacterium]|nr:hypothetical protein [Synergistaceae bacterium]
MSWYHEKILPHMMDHVASIDHLMYLRERTAERIARSGLDVELVQAGAENIPIGEETFDYRGEAIKRN